MLSEIHRTLESKRQWYVGEIVQLGNGYYLQNAGDEIHLCHPDDEKYLVVAVLDPALRVWFKTIGSSN